MKLFFLTDKIRNGTMFDISLMDNFREYDENDPIFSIPENVKKAWFSFLFDFCPCVSYEWSTYLANFRHDGYPPFMEFLSASDETFTVWMIKIKYDRVKKEMEGENREISDEVNTANRKRKFGSHDSRTHLDLYVDLYHQQIKPKLENKYSVEFLEKQFHCELLNLYGSNMGSCKIQQNKCTSKIEDLPLYIF